MTVKYWLLLLFLQITLSASTKETTISECTVKGGECNENGRRPVCGTDNITYPSRCHLIRAQCSGQKVNIKYTGACRECKEARLYALEHRVHKYVPRCRSDGSYALVQCMNGAGCWCANRQGQPIQNTATRSVNRKPNCSNNSTSKSNKRRSSPSRRISNNRLNGKKRDCSKENIAKLNQLLIELFNSKYREHKGLQTNGSISDKIILDWRFSAYDKNGNTILDKQEYKELKKLAREIAQPKRCGRLFGKYCDINNDGRLSKQEWDNCLTKDGVNLLRQKMVPESDPIIRENDSESDCLSDRQVALEEQKNGPTTQHYYVPECTPDGRYQRIQCYRSTGYCWCVNEDTGRNIEGTPIKNARPDCSITVSRPMKGCPEKKKNEFFINLKIFLKDYVENNNASKNITLTKVDSEDERIATLAFVLSDFNQNKVLEKKEWSEVKKLIVAQILLRKCGRKMPRYCDVNNDKKITLSEWLNCLQASSNFKMPIASELQDNRPAANVSKFRGPNPFDTILKSD